MIVLKLTQRQLNALALTRLNLSSLGMREDTSQAWRDFATNLDEIFEKNEPIKPVEFKECGGIRIEETRTRNELELIKEFEGSEHSDSGYYSDDEQESVLSYVDFLEAKIYELNQRYENLLNENK